MSRFMGIHKGSKIIVCGCGTSLTGFKEHSKNYITIGVNDVPALFDPTYLLITDPPGRFKDGRRELVNNSKAKYLFTCAPGWTHPRIVHFELGTHKPLNLDSPNKIDHFINSPYPATCLAYKLGAAHIGLIGVDFTDGHFYNTKDGPHPVVTTKSLKKVNDAFLELSTIFKSKNVKLYNLSQESKLELPKLTINEFNTL